MAYIELDITIPDNRTTGCDITIAELSASGFESFVETENGLKAYIREDIYNPEVLSDITIVRSEIFGETEIKSALIKDRNWNEIWESEYEPVSVPGFCFIRSPFHAKSDSHKYEVIIEPKMSFGTGHHETTWLMLKMMENIDFLDREVLDIGCGTGVLSIMASKLSASNITAIDIDSWAYKNSIENLEVNSIKNCTVIHGDIGAINEKKYDIILANITRNVLLDSMMEYGSLCRSGGFMLLSGFYSKDLEIMKSRALSRGFNYIEHISKNNWVSVLFKRHD